MLNFHASRLAAFFKAFGFLLAIAALLLAITSDTAFVHRTLSDQSLADVRGTNPMVAKVRGVDCTDYARGVIAEDNPDPVVRADNCTDNSANAVCIACRIGTFTNSAQQRAYPPQSAPIDPNSPLTVNCGLQASGNTGSYGKCRVSPDGNSVLCFSSGPTQCYPTSDWNFQ